MSNKRVVNCQDLQIKDIAFTNLSVIPCNIPAAKDSFFCSGTATRNSVSKNFGVITERRKCFDKKFKRFLYDAINYSMSGRVR